MNAWAIALILLSGLSGWLIAKVKADKKNLSLKAENKSLTEQLTAVQAREAEANDRLQEARSEGEKHRIALSRKEVELEKLQEARQRERGELENLQKKFGDAFENLANRILEQKSEKFTLQNKANLENLLGPLEKRIQRFEEKVEQTNKEQISRNEGLKQQISNLKTLNEQVTQETHNLIRALKSDSKTQGNWGELVLERILEKSGLEKGREFDVQQRYTAEDGSQQKPDVIIHLPDGKSLIIDAKVSLTAYEKWCNEEDEGRRAAFLKQHLNSLEGHIKELGEKHYHMLQGVKAPEFVLMFVPIEPAFASALAVKHDLYGKAFDRNIVIVTPSTLLATLRTIASLWQHENRQRNAEEIARQAGTLYDKFAGLVEDLKMVGRRLDGAKTSYEDAMNKLCEGRDNLVRKVEKLRTLGAKSKKTLPTKLLNRADEDA